MASQTRLIYEFGDFQLELDERKLLRRGQVIPLHGKAFEMLLVLIRNRGRLLTKDELFQLVWPDQIVEESNLTVNMSAIRRALGERASHPRYITTVSGRGYRFTADVRQCADETLTIERESFARVVVQEEETGSGALVQFGRRVATAVRRITSHPVLLLITFVAVLAIGSAAFWVRWRHRTSAARPAWSNVTLHRFVTQGGVPYRVAISPDGKSLVYRQRIKGKESLWLGQVEGNSSVMIRDEPDITYDSLAFAPDGQSVYAIERDRNQKQSKLVRLPLFGGVATELTADIDSSITFSPDGNQIAFLRNDSQTKQSSIVIANASDGKNERIVSFLQSPERFTSDGLSWAPDGKSIAVAANTGERKRNQIVSVRVADGAREKIGSRDWGIVAQLIWLHDQSGLLTIGRENWIARKNQIWFV